MRDEMSQTKTHEPMTTDEIALLREIVRWRKNHDIQLHTHDFIYHRPTDWNNAYGPKRGAAVTVENDYGLYSIGVDAKGGGRSYDFKWFDVTSVTQAVDLLVFLGMLPPRFSSAYRAGWDSCEGWYRKTEHGAGDLPAQRASANRQVDA